MMSMATNFETRFLLVLWDLGGASVPKGKVNDRFSGKTKDANMAREALVRDGAIELSEDGKRLTLTDAGKKTLGNELAQGFVFEAQIGTKMANALLRWMRSVGASRTVVAKLEVEAKSEVEAIASYEAFKVVVLEVFDRLNRDFNMNDLVPIYRIRRDIGDRVERAQFNEWLLKMQSEDICQLAESGVEDSAADKIADSITTKLGKLRCYVKLLGT
jgi:hypothetical protein